MKTFFPADNSGRLWRQVYLCRVFSLPRFLSLPFRGLPLPYSSFLSNIFSCSRQRRRWGRGARAKIRLISSTCRRCSSRRFLPAAGRRRRAPIGWWVRNEGSFDNFHQYGLHVVREHTGVCRYACLADDRFG